MAESIVTLQLEPSGGATAQLSADAFVLQFGALLKALSEFAKAHDGGKNPLLSYRISALSTNSPATVTVQPDIQNADSLESANAAHSDFMRGIEAIDNGDDPPAGFTFPVIEALRTFVRPIGESVTGGYIATEFFKFPLTYRFKQNLAKLEARGRVERNSSIKGMIEHINIHGKSYVFTLYPALGPRRLRCVFNAKNLEEVKKGIGQNVLVKGDLKYDWRDKWPSEIAVKHLRVLEDVAKLPRFEAVFGIAPRAAGGLSAEDFVENLRNGEI